MKEVAYRVKMRRLAKQRIRKVLWAKNLVDEKTFISDDDESDSERESDNK